MVKVFISIFAILNLLQASSGTSDPGPSLSDCRRRCNEERGPAYSPPPDTSLVCVENRENATFCMAHCYYDGCRNKGIDWNGPCPYCPEEGCPAIFDLVCAQEYNYKATYLNATTYLNACEANCDGQKVIHRGPCTIE